MRWISAIGLGFTLKQMLDNFQFSKEKVTKEHISNIKGDAGMMADNAGR